MQGHYKKERVSGTTLKKHLKAYALVTLIILVLLLKVKLDTNVQDLFRVKSVFSNKQQEEY